MRRALGPVFNQLELLYVALIIGGVSAACLQASSRLIDLAHLTEIVFFVRDVQTYEAIDTAFLGDKNSNLSVPSAPALPSSISRVQAVAPSALTIKLSSLFTMMLEGKTLIWQKLNSINTGGFQFEYWSCSKNSRYSFVELKFDVESEVTPLGEGFSRVICP